MLFFLFQGSLSYKQGEIGILPLTSSNLTYLYSTCLNLFTQKSLDSFPNVVSPNTYSNHTKHTKVLRCSNQKHHNNRSTQKPQSLANTTQRSFHSISITPFISWPYLLKRNTQTCFLFPLIYNITHSSSFFTLSILLALSIQITYEDMSQMQILLEWTENCS